MEDGHWFSKALASEGKPPNEIPGDAIPHNAVLDGGEKEVSAVRDLSPSSCLASQKEEEDEALDNEHWLTLGSQPWKNDAANVDAIDGNRKELPDLNIALQVGAALNCGNLDLPPENEDCLQICEDVPQDADLGHSELESMWNLCQWSDGDHLNQDEQGTGSAKQSDGHIGRRLLHQRSDLEANCWSKVEDHNGQLHSNGEGLLGNSDLEIVAADGYTVGVGGTWGQRWSTASLGQPGEGNAFVGRTNRRKQARPRLLVQDDASRRILGEEGSQKDAFAFAMHSGQGAYTRNTNVDDDPMFVPPHAQFFETRPSSFGVETSAKGDPDGFDSLSVPAEHSEEEGDVPPLDPEHPSLRPVGDLLHSCYLILLKASPEGLTAREVVTKMLDSGMTFGPNLGKVLPRAQVTHAMQSSPYFLEMEGRFHLCSSVVTQNPKANAPAPSRIPRRKQREGGGRDVPVMVLDAMLNEMHNDEIGGEEEEEEELPLNWDDMPSAALPWDPSKIRQGPAVNNHNNKRQMEEYSSSDDEEEQPSEPLEVRGQVRRMLKKTRRCNEKEQGFDTSQGLATTRAGSAAVAAGSSGMDEGVVKHRMNLGSKVGTLRNPPSGAGLGPGADGYWDKRREEGQSNDSNAVEGASRDEMEDGLRGGFEDDYDNRALKERAIALRRAMKQMTNTELNQAARMAGSAYKLYKRKREKQEKDIERSGKRPRKDEIEILDALKLSELEKMKEVQMFDREKEGRKKGVSTVLRSVARRTTETVTKQHLIPPATALKAKPAVATAARGKPVAAPAVKAKVVKSAPGRTPRVRVKVKMQPTKKSIASPKIKVQPTKKTSTSQKVTKATLQVSQAAAEGEEPEEEHRRCARRDNKGWVCPMRATPGRFFCAYHIERERMERERRRLKTAGMSKAATRKPEKGGKKGPTWLPRISKGVGVSVPAPLPKSKYADAPQLNSRKGKRKAVPETGFNALVAKRAALLLGERKTMALLGGEKTLSHHSADAKLAHRAPPTKNSHRVSRKRPRQVGKEAKAGGGAKGKGVEAAVVSAPAETSVGVNEGVSAVSGSVLPGRKRRRGEAVALPKVKKPERKGGEKGVRGKAAAASAEAAANGKKGAMPAGRPRKVREPRQATAGMEGSAVAEGEGVQNRRTRSQVQKQGARV